MSRKITAAEFDAIQKAKSILTEYFDNIGIFGNCVDEDGSTTRFEFLSGNWFALQYQIENWLDTQPTGFERTEEQSSAQDGEADCN